MIVIRAIGRTHREEDVELATGLVLLLQCVAPLQLQPVANFLMILW